ncbi:MAG TPA: PQQ-binding-like beta-propeller repeat protein [Jatrophihabitans sp.]|nr:PQQ-binding-like beta-propeller repeat protein [Jatrophihabitans sp.]
MVLAVLVTALAPVAGAQAALGDWAQFGYGAAHNGYQRYETAIGRSTVANLRSRWVIPCRLCIAPSAVVNGRLFAGSRVNHPPTAPVNPTGRLSAWNARTGVLLWRRPLDRPAYLSAPAVVNGIAYVTTQDWSFSGDGTGGSLYAFDASTGALLWRRQVHARTSPAVIDGMVFIAGGASSTTDTTVWAFGARHGALRWKATQPGTFYLLDHVAPTVARGRVFLGLPGGSVVAFDELTGALVWRAALPSSSGEEAPLAVGNGLVVASENGIGLYARDAATGGLRWSYTPAGANAEIQPVAPAIANGVVFLLYNGLWHDGGSGDRAAALRLADGLPIWDRELPQRGTQTRGAPTVANGVVYVPDFPGIDALRTSDGRVLRTFSVAPGDAYGSAIISNGSLYTVELNAGIRRFALP